MAGASQHGGSVDDVLAGRAPVHVARGVGIVFATFAVSALTRGMARLHFAGGRRQCRDIESIDPACLPIAAPRLRGSNRAASARASAARNPACAGGSRIVADARMAALENIVRVEATRSCS